jgi:hypothetical protein
MSAEKIYWPRVIAWAATVLCAIVSARGATGFAKRSPRVFTVLALFSLNWAILIPFYSSSKPSILLAGFAGFLLVYVGVLLRRESHSPLATDQRPSSNISNYIREEVARRDRISLWLLGLLITPSAVSFLPTTILPINSSHTELVTSSFITYVGYYSVCSAVRVYSRRRWGWWLLTAVAIPYALVDAWFTFQTLFHPPAIDECIAVVWSCPSTLMSKQFLYLFAILKILFSSVFIYLVLDESLSDEDRRLPFVDKCLRFVMH